MRNAEEHGDVALALLATPGGGSSNSSSCRLERGDVRCSGVSASGLRCTRTLALGGECTTSSDDAFCYKHRRQRRLSQWCGAGCCGYCTRRTSSKTSESWKTSAPLLLAVLATASLAVGVMRRDVTVCAAGALALTLATLWMCVAIWELLWRAVPPELVAQIAFDVVQQAEKNERQERRGASVA